MKAGTNKKQSTFTDLSTDFFNNSSRNTKTLAWNLIEYTDIERSSLLKSTIILPGKVPSLIQSQKLYRSAQQELLWDNKSKIVSCLFYNQVGCTTSCYLREALILEVDLSHAKFVELVPTPRHKHHHQLSFGLVFQGPRAPITPLILTNEPFTWKTQLWKSILWTDFYSDFKLDKKIGSGSFAETYKIKLKNNSLNFSKIEEKNNLKKISDDKSTQEGFYAAKFVEIRSIKNDPKLLGVLETEIKVHRELIHQNIVGMRALYQTEDHIVIVLELIEGETLTKRCYSSSRPYLEMKSRLKVMLGLFEGLYYLYKSGVIHRDISPNNLMIDSNNRLRIIDFGLSFWLGDNNPISRAGTRGFIAPEIFFQNESSCIKYDFSVDMYSAGVIQYMLASGCSSKHLTMLDSLDFDEGSLHQNGVLQSEIQFIKRATCSDRAERIKIEDVFWEEIFTMDLFPEKQNINQITHKYKTAQKSSVIFGSTGQKRNRKGLNKQTPSLYLKTLSQEDPCFLRYGQKGYTPKSTMINFTMDEILV